MAAGQTAGAAKPVNADGIMIRLCHRLDEMRACVALQKEVWNFTDAELVPLRLFVVAEKVGGQVMGAYQGTDLVGFGLAVPGFRNGHSYLHSHMVGVHKDFRNVGLGRKIKWFQRDDALARGFELIEWTFDPLEIKNSYLNIEKLGAITRRYNVNQYGITSSPLQGGLPTDRLVAEWWLQSARVKNAAAECAHRSFIPEQRIPVPANIYQWKADPQTRTQALAVQDQNRALFLQAFAADLAVLGYERDSAGNGAFQLGHWDEKWQY
jgi:predicted GNAT superfamily acetyltransferase